MKECRKPPNGGFWPPCLAHALSRILADAGYKGRKTPPGYKFKVYTQGQKRGVTETIKRQFSRRAAIEPVIGHTKSEHRMERNYLAHRAGDAANAVLAAAGYNFRRLIRWLPCFLRRWFRLYADATSLNFA